VHLCAGTDKCIRYWLVNKPEESFIVCGPKQAGFASPNLPTQAAGTTAAQDVPTWTTAISYVHQMQADVGVLTEHHTLVRDPPQSGARSRPVADTRAKQRIESLCHRDCIQDMAIADQHDPVLLSASRDGIIKAWR
jgi:hypothetical protein